MGRHSRGEGGVVSMGKRAEVWLGAILVLGGLLMSCGTKKEGQTIGPPTETVRQGKQWPQGRGQPGIFPAPPAPVVLFSRDPSFAEAGPAAFLPEYSEHREPFPSKGCPRVLGGGMMKGNEGTTPRILAVGPAQPRGRFTRA